MKIYKKEDFPALLRSVKLSIVTGELKPEVIEEEYQEFTKSEEYKKYLEHYSDGVITGSIALKLIGVPLNREFKPNRFIDKFVRFFKTRKAKWKNGRLITFINDIDIIFPEDRKLEVSYRYAYSGNVLENYKGTKDYDDTTIDFFTQDDVSYIEYKDIKIAKPQHILETKLKMNDAEITSVKHYTDLCDAFHYFNN